MPFDKPFHRNYRAIISGPNSGYSDWGYIVDPEYAKFPEHYIRAFLLIQSDLEKLFEYIEPADDNLKTFSYRIHELLIRTCIEIEANFKAILKENIYSPCSKKGKERLEKNWNLINDYYQVNKTHHLDSYKVSIPIWRGYKSQFTPFIEWKSQKTLSWYSAYNYCKHDRQDKFCYASFENLLNAVAGLFVLLSSQFRTEDFSPKNRGLAVSGNDYYKGKSGLGGFFRIIFPDDWEDNEKYCFDWNVLKDQSDKFNKIDYNLIKNSL